MKKYFMALVLGVMLMGIVGCSTLDKRATYDNLRMTYKETRENDKFWTDSDVADSIKNAAKIRNEQHRDLAEAMAKSAKNTEDEIEKAKLGN